MNIHEYSWGVVGHGWWWWVVGRGWWWVMVGGGRWWWLVLVVVGGGCKSEFGQKSSLTWGGDMKLDP